MIGAAGKLNPASQADSVAIGKLTVGGNVENVQIAAGYSLAGAPTHGDASMGPVQVGGNWAGSDLLAGIKDGGDGSFGSVAGHVDDILIPGGNLSILAKIASVTINGQLLGTPAVAGDSHAFAAEVIGSLKLGGTSIPLPGVHNALAFSDPNLDDVTVEEL